METGKKIFYLSSDTGKESGNISTPDITDYFSPTICINLNLRPCRTDKSKTHFEFLSVFAFLRLILNSNRARQIAEKQSTRKINYH